MAASRTIGFPEELFGRLGHLSARAIPVNSKEGRMDSNGIERTRTELKGLAMHIATNAGGRRHER